MKRMSFQMHSGPWLMSPYLVCILVILSCLGCSKEFSEEDTGIQSIRDGEVALLRQGNQYGAIKVIQQTRDPEVIVYSGCYGREGVSLLSSNEVVFVSGEGGNTIVMGPFTVYWSAAINGVGYLYPTPEADVCVTELTSLEGIDASNQKWRYRLLSERWTGE